MSLKSIEGYGSIGLLKWYRLPWCSHHLQTQRSTLQLKLPTSRRSWGCWNGIDCQDAAHHHFHRPQRITESFSSWKIGEWGNHLSRNKLLEIIFEFLTIFFVRRFSNFHFCFPLFVNLFICFYFFNFMSFLELYPLLL